MDNFLLNDPATTEIYTLSLHDALPISSSAGQGSGPSIRATSSSARRGPSSQMAISSTSSCPPTARISCSAIRACRSEEHTSELQSQSNLVCRLLLEKEKHSNRNDNSTT